MSIKALVIFGEPDPSQKEPVFYEVSKRISKQLGENWAIVSTHWVRNVFAVRKRQGTNPQQDKIAYRLLTSVVKDLAEEGYNLVVTGVFPTKEDEFRPALDLLKKLQVVPTIIWIKGCENPFWMEEKNRQTYHKLLNDHRDFNKDFVVDLNEYKDDIKDLEKRIKYVLESLAGPLLNHGITLGKEV